MDPAPRPTPRPTPGTPADASHPEASDAERKPCRVLVLSPRRVVRDRLAAQLAERADLLSVHQDPRAAVGDLASRTFDVALIDGRAAPGEPGLGDGIELCRLVRAAAPETACILLASAPRLEDALDAMRAGAVDVLPPRIARSELLARVEAAANRVPGPVLSQFSPLAEPRARASNALLGLCTALPDAQSPPIPAADHAELGEALADSLEIEDALRATLEFLLARAGSTNAALFIACASGEFALGAFINYDRERDSAEFYFDRLAGFLAPAAEDADGLLRLETDEELRDALGEDAAWLDGQSVLAVPCNHGPRCFGVIALFREQRAPFPEELDPVLSAAAAAYARQAARIARVTHRLRHEPGAWGEGWEHGGNGGQDLGHDRPGGLAA